ncbi:hypothetical protein BSK59_14005 [Paenibacillus odorifer]|uniref:hypothetical protein n=1 Tax=Paenibacillus odorifer TaxID=189426 RepID=UPI00096D8703|nr:hypothetical protein [Paenibacillus odorifer]OME55582.1 hypothetical protein BSK59_14005 [Paenibacillus odorifer]
MTQVKDKTHQQLNRALAELMGWTKIQILESDRIWARKPEDEWSSDVPDYHWSDYVPDYCNDPAASLEVQAKAIEVDAQGYLYNLATVVNGYEAADIWEDDEIISMLKATSRERAEAAYITLSISKEDLNGTVGYRSEEYTTDLNEALKFGSKLEAQKECDVLEYPKQIQ